MVIKNFILIYIIYFLIIFSSIGYGGIFTNFFINRNMNYGYQGLFGIFFLIIYSYVSNFFYAHNLIHNTFVLTFGLLLFFIINKNYRSIYLCIIIFSLLFVSLIVFKTHDDFPYYHFPYTHYLTQTKLMYGIGYFNHGFRTPSSIFYLNSLYYLPFFKFFFYHMGAVLIMGFVNIIFYEKIAKYKLNKLDFLFFFTLLSILFINIFFYRIAEHGTDRSAQILVFLLIIELYFLLNEKS